MLEDRILFRRNQKRFWETEVTEKNGDYGKIRVSRQNDRKPQHSELREERCHGFG